MSIISWIILGLIAGFIGSKIVKGEGQGFWLNIALGIIGAIVGGFLFEYCLGRPRARSRLSAEDHRPCLTKARSGPPRGCPPPLYATVAHHIGRTSDGGSEGMASPDPSNIKIKRNTETELHSISIASPPRSARWNEEMDDRSARRNHEAGCQDGPSRSFS